MKMSLHELKEKTTLDFEFDFTSSLTSVPDMLSIQPAKIHLDWSWVQDHLMMTLNLTCQMELACAKTLKPVPYAMDLNTEIIFGDIDDADYPLEDPIYISDIIFGYIVTEKPYTIYHPDAEKTTFEKEKSPHPAFADLDKNYKT